MTAALPLPRMTGPMLFCSPTTSYASTVCHNRSVHSLSRLRGGCLATPSSSHLMLTISRQIP
nr:MAG TPA: hypothetical protein [Caudoviricetes sp.]